MSQASRPQTKSAETATQPTRRSGHTHLPSAALASLAKLLRLVRSVSVMLALVFTTKRLQMLTTRATSLLSKLGPCHPQ